MGLISYLKRRIDLADEEFFSQVADCRNRNMDFFNQQECSGRYFRMDGVLCRAIEQGEGEECPTEKDTVVCDYECSLVDGSVVASAAGNSPETLQMETLIDGLRTALGRMHVGDKWEVIVPPALAYGSLRFGLVPSFSTLVFTISLIDIIR